MRRHRWNKQTGLWTALGILALGFGGATSLSGDQPQKNASGGGFPVAPRIRPGNDKYQTEVTVNALVLAKVVASVAARQLSPMTVDLTPGKTSAPPTQGVIQLSGAPNSSAFLLVASAKPQVTSVDTGPSSGAPQESARITVSDIHVGSESGQAVFADNGSARITYGGGASITARGVRSGSYQGTIDMTVVY